MNYRQHKDGRYVVAVGSRYSIADLKQRGFLAMDFVLDRDHPTAEQQQTVDLARRDAVAYDEGVSS